MPVQPELGHIPLLVAWPGVAPTTCDALTTTVDLHATLCDAFDVTPEHRTHGRSLRPLLEGTATSIREWALCGVWGREVHVADATRTYARVPVEGNRPLSMWSNRWSTMPIHALPDFRMPRPDDRAWLDRLPGSEVPVIRQPFDASDRLPFWAMGHFEGELLYDRAECDAEGERARPPRRRRRRPRRPRRWPTSWSRPSAPSRPPQEQLVRLGLELDRSPMKFQKLTSTDGFIAFDLGDAPAVGVVRVAPKVLRDGAELLARSTTYAAASFGLQVGGGSAGLNAKPDARDAAVAAFLEEVGELVGSGRWIVGRRRRHRRRRAGRPPRTPTARAAAFDPVALGESAVAAALGALGSSRASGSASWAPGPSPMPPSPRPPQNGATVHPGVGIDGECDALLVAGKAGVLEHDLAATVKAKVVVPLSPVPVTARALAILGRADVVVVPDFLSTAGPLLTALDAGAGDPMERVHDAVAALAGEGTGLWMAAVGRAEEHLRSWQDELPFGRPLA